MPGLEIEYKAAKKAAKGFLNAESRAHDTLHVALASAYKFYVAGRAKPTYMEEILSQAGLSPTNLTPASNQVVKLFFYPEKSAQSEKRQTISKWAIVLRECELAGVKPKDSKDHIAQHTIDGLVEANRQRQSSSGAPSTGKTMTKFEQGKRIVQRMPSLAEFELEGSFSDGLGLALIEFDGTTARIRSVVADESDRTTQAITQNFAGKYPWGATEFLPLGLLCRVARAALGGGKSLAGIISNGSNGAKVRIARSGMLKTGLARGFFPKIEELPDGDYYFDSKTVQLFCKLLPRYRTNDWNVTTSTNGVAIKIKILSGTSQIGLPKYDGSSTLASLSAEAKKPMLNLPLDKPVLEKLTGLEAAFKAGKAKTITHHISDGRWEMEGLGGQKTRVIVPKGLGIGNQKIGMDFSDDTLKRMEKCMRAVTATYKEATTSLLVGEGYLALSICDLYGGLWEFVMPQKKDRDYDPALMTYDEVDQEPLCSTS